MQITLAVCSTQAPALCPLCTAPAQRLHSYYERTLAADLKRVLTVGSVTVFGRSLRPMKLYVVCRAKARLGVHTRSVQKLSLTYYTHNRDLCGTAASLRAPAW
jgi:hypothetical protein